MAAIERLLEIMTKLRDPDGGCPWDLAQTYQSIVPHTLEEAYEVAETIELQDYAALCDELGDLLFQIVFYAQLAKEQGRFDFNDVVLAIADKLERRHPHVFAGHQFESDEARSQHWEQTKQQERTAKQSSETASQLDGITRTLPALSFARKLQSRAAQVGFDWPEVSGVFDKLHEEIDELREAWTDPAQRADELGDVLFTCVNLSRHAGEDPEAVLRQANRKFEHRFRSMEAIAAQKKQDLANLDTEHLEQLWQQAKQKPALESI